jgi:hypothetical protein
MAMAAPKHWGYTRGKDIPDEILVSWADGDLTAQVAQEVDETLLGNREQRRLVAAYARAAADSVGEEITAWHGKRPGKRALHLLRPRPGLVDTIIQEYGGHPGDWESGALSARSDAESSTSGATAEAPAQGGMTARRVFSILVTLVVTAVVIVWMVRNL